MPYQSPLEKLLIKHNAFQPVNIPNMEQAQKQMTLSLDKELKFSSGSDTNPYGDKTVTDTYKKLKELNPSN